MPPKDPRDTFTYIASTFEFRMKGDGGWPTRARGYKDLYLNYTKTYYKVSLLPWLRAEHMTVGNNRDFTRENKLFAAYR